MIKKRKGIVMKDKKNEEEKRARKCGYYFKPKAEIQRKAIIKNLNKTSDEEALKRSNLSKWMKKR